MKKVLKLSFSIFLAMTMSLSNVVSIFAQEEQSEQIEEEQLLTEKQQRKRQQEEDQNRLISAVLEEIFP